MLAAMKRAARSSGQEAHPRSAGHIPGLIRRLAAATVNYGLVKQRRTWVFTRGPMRRFGQLDLLKRDALSTYDQFWITYRATLP